MPTLVIVAGPNGSGKTTVVRSGELALALPVPTISVNADDIAMALAGGNLPTDEQSLQAARLADAMVDELIGRQQSFIVETVLSSDKYKARVQAAKSAGYQVILVFVAVRMAALNVERVANRFSLGGHAVPRDRVEARRVRSYAMFQWFAAGADTVMVFDNSGPAPRIGAVAGPSGWLARYLGGAPTDGRSEWMPLDMDPLDPDLAARVRGLAANG